MTEFERFLHKGSPGQRAMLGAAKDDAPSGSAQKRLLFALGLGSAIASVASASQAVSSAATTAGPSALLSAPAPSGIECTVASTETVSLAAPAALSLAAPAASVTAVLVLKWCAVATVALSMGVAGGLLARHVVGSPPVVAVAIATHQPERRTARGTSEVGVVANQANHPPVAKLDAARAEATLPLPPPHPAATRPAVSNTGDAAGLTVRGEIALVEQARNSLHRGDPEGCLSFLETRRKGVRGGVLAPEAAILQIEALRALGQRARATEEAMRFRHDYPDSPLLERIRELF